MSSSTTTVKVMVASYTKGGVFEEGEFRTMADVLSEYAIDVADATIEVTSQEGEERTVAPTGLLREGDSIIIMKSKNKSGR